MPEGGHQLDQLPGNLSFRISLAPRSARWRLRRAISAQIRGDDAVTVRKPWSDPMPAGVGLREAMQQQQRRAIAALGEEVTRIAHSMVPVLEPRQRHTPCCRRRIPTSRLV
jgi:hypothetical protein